MQQCWKENSLKHFRLNCHSHMFAIIFLKAKKFSNICYALRQLINPALNCNLISCLIILSRLMETAIKTAKFHSSDLFSYVNSAKI